MFALAPGQMAAFPVKVGSLYYVVRVEGRRQGHTLTFEEAWPMLEKAVREEAVREAAKNAVEQVRIVSSARE